MKTPVAIAIWAGLLAGAAQADCRFGAPQQRVDPLLVPDAVARVAIPEPGNLWGTVSDGTRQNRALTPQERLSLAAGAIYEAREDLDGDGRPERCYHLSTTATCSNGVVQCLHVVTDASGETVLLETATHQLTPLPWPFAGGMRMLQAVAVGPDGDIRAVLFRFDGAMYRPSDSRSLGPLFPE